MNVRECHCRLHSILLSFSFANILKTTLKKTTFLFLNLSIRSKTKTLLRPEDLQPNTWYFSTVLKIKFLKTGSKLTSIITQPLQSSVLSNTVGFALLPNTPDTIALIKNVKFAILANIRVLIVLFLENLVQKSRLQRNKRRSTKRTLPTSHYPMNSKENNLK